MNPSTVSKDCLVVEIVPLTQLVIGLGWEGTELGFAEASPMLTTPPLSMH